MRRCASTGLLQVLIVIGSISSITIGCRATSQIGGAYIARDSNGASMLQLTQTATGQITGVFDYVALDSSGKISTDEVPITSGVLDGKQLTLTLNGSILGFGRNIAGTMEGNTIRLQIVGSQGDISTLVFARSSPEEFQRDTKQLKAKGQEIVFNAKLLKDSQELLRTTQIAEQWISNAELHAQRIPAVKDYYGQIEDKMRSLVAKERGTYGSVDRNQISIEVGQEDIAGEQADIQISQTWDYSIEREGVDLSNEFANWPANCGTVSELQRRGASDQAIEAWENACKQTSEERERFQPILKQIMEQRAELKAFQATAETHRKALVAEAERSQ
jgi:hypothetical protein